MELRNYIEEGIAKAGGTTALATMIQVKPNQVTDTKGMRISLPVPACYALAELIGRDAGEIIAASELVTEKKPERRAVLMRYLAKMGSTAAGVALIVGAALPDQAHASMAQVIDNPETVIFRSYYHGAILSSNCRGCVHHTVSPLLLLLCGRRGCAASRARCRRRASARRRT